MVKVKLLSDVQLFALTDFKTHSGIISLNGSITNIARLT